MQPEPVVTKVAERKPAMQSRAERTRRTILAATVKSLAERGYAETSTLQIQSDAGVSRGRLLHHFPQKQQLMIAAVQHLATERFDALRSVPIESTGAARAEEAVRRVWSTYDGDLFWADIELWMVARHDPDLASALAIEERRINRVARGLCDDMFGPEFTSRPSYPDYRAFLISSMRGVALTYTFDRKPLADDPHVAVWTAMAVKLLDEEPIRNP